MEFTDGRQMEVPQWWLKPKVERIAVGATCHVVDRNSPVPSNSSITKLAYYQLRIDEVCQETCRCSVSKRMN